MDITIWSIKLLQSSLYIFWVFSLLLGQVLISPWVQSCSVYISFLVLLFGCTEVIINHSCTAKEISLHLLHFHSLMSFSPQWDSIICLQRQLCPVYQFSVWCRPNARVFTNSQSGSSIITKNRFSFSYHYFFCNNVFISIQRFIVSSMAEVALVKIYISSNYHIYSEAISCMRNDFQYSFDG